MRDPDAPGRREAGLEPRYHDYPGKEQFEQAWFLWRAIRRDAQPTGAELDAKWQAEAECLGVAW